MQCRIDIEKTETGALVPIIRDASENIPPDTPIIELTTVEELYQAYDDVSEHIARTLQEFESELDTAIRKHLGTSEQLAEDFIASAIKQRELIEKYESLIEKQDTYIAHLEDIVRSYNEEDSNINKR